MGVRGIRGAITVEANEAKEIAAATLELTRAIVEANAIDPVDICSVLVTVTADLDDTFPAQSIRQLPGWELVPLMCSLEVPVKGSLEKCIRLMLLVNTDKGQAEIEHVYLQRARILRPDLTKQ
ncbi:chorismate mutase [Paenibacillus yanchengensis]|uniref:chorismate mutase n=1 Tax=Paenibacillus yanchengensis TaxID=2035833 RepID=A0ABW4YJW2_9BACL